MSMPKPLTLQDLNAAMSSRKDDLLEPFINRAIGIYCNIRKKTVGPRPEKMSGYSGEYGEAYYIAFNAVYEVWTGIGATFNPALGNFDDYFNSLVHNEICDLLQSGGRTDLLSQPSQVKVKGDIYKKSIKVDADNYWGDDGSEPDNTDSDKEEKIRVFMSDALAALISFVDTLPEKERNVFQASLFGRTFSPQPDKYGRNYAEELARQYNTTAVYIRKLATQVKDKVLAQVQAQGFNKRAFTSIQMIQAKPSYIREYEEIVEATETITPFEQFLLLKHIEDITHPLISPSSGSAR